MQAKTNKTIVWIPSLFTCVEVVLWQKLPQPHVTQRGTWKTHVYQLRSQTNASICILVKQNTSHASKTNKTIVRIPSLFTCVEVVLWQKTTSTSCNPTRHMKNSCVSIKVSKPMPASASLSFVNQNTNHANWPTRPWRCHPYIPQNNASINTHMLYINMHLPFHRQNGIEKNTSNNEG